MTASEYIEVQDGAIAYAVGIEVVKGRFVPILQRGTSVPCERTEVFTTGSDNQTDIKVAVFCGASEFVSGNRLVGRYAVLLTDPAPAGEPAINVRFRVDEGGIFHLDAGPVPVVRTQ